jgi:midasin
MSTADQNWQAAAQPQSSSGQQRPKPDASQSNPYESLGDVSKKFRQRVELLQRNQDAVPMEEPESQQPQADESDKKDDHGLFEHVGENEKADDQALGSATQEQMEQMGQLDKEENAPTEPDQKEEKVEQRPDDSAANQDQEQASKSLVGGSARLNRPDQEDSEHESEEHDSEDVEMEDTPDTWLDEMLNRAEKPDTEMQESSIGNLQVSSSSSTALVPAAAAAPLDPEALERLRTELDDKLQAWQSGQDVNAVDLWRRFEQVTIELSMQLCEQLRIILEPSLATKLRGDYRTGKRINMKKVIPYIASQFRKDKIWLRRTKPSKRQYQVMIAIDDSESMRTNGAGRLALEALVVLCKALTQLEVGQLSVVSFGDDVQLLHPFDRPFTETSGAYALSAFKFDQAKTHWPRFLETAVTLLTEAKQDSSAGDEQLQLMFVISDARVQQDRETVARWTREAAERRQLLVLIVIDANATGPNSAQSILSLKSVTYPNGKIKVVEYLENFPFPYYIILRQLSALPEIVADALRQWFELIQSSK